MANQDGKTDHEGKSRREDVAALLPRGPLPGILAPPGTVGRAAGRFPADGAVDPCGNVSKFDTLSIFVTLAPAWRERNEFRYVFRGRTSVAVFRSPENTGAPARLESRTGASESKRRVAGSAGYTEKSSGLRGSHRPEPTGTFAGSFVSVRIRLSSSTNTTWGSRERASSSVIIP